MEYDADGIRGFLQQVASHTNPPSPDSTPTLPHGQAWVSNGGVAASGVKYAPASDAVAWGNKGCPLLPRDMREQHKGVRLPRDLEQAFGLSLKVDQLDSELLGLVDWDTLTGRAAGMFREFLYSLGSPDDQVAIPAGIPLTWFEGLPLTGRTRNCVRRAFQGTGTVSFLGIPMLAHEFLRIRSVGLSTLNELKCVVESAELERASDKSAAGPSDDYMPPTATEQDEQVHETAVQLARNMSSFNEQIYRFARWAIAETESQTFGEAIAELIQIGMANETWKAVASVRLLDLAARPQHPYEVLDEWAKQMDPRSRTIFLARVSGHPQTKLTLEALAAEFGVTRERIRQVEVKIRRSLETFLSSDVAAPIRWRAETLRQELNVAAPIDTVAHLLRAPSGCNDYRAILLEMAGPYDHEQEWYTLRSAQASDPTSNILTQADDAGRINGEFASSRLTDWGLHAAFHNEWLTRDGSVRLFGGQLVLWGTSIADRLMFALADIGRPATVDEMVNHVGENRSRYSISNALADDPRLLRVSRTQWGLASWGLPEYSGVADAMRSMLQESGEVISVEDVVRRMGRTFGVAESTTLAYCNAPMFVVEGEFLRLRDHDSEPFIYGSDSLQRTPGVFCLGSMRLARLFKVNSDILRGSGTTLTHAAGALLGIEVNAHLSFNNQHGDRVDITFPESSLIGPTFGSIRRIAERLSAKEGQCLTLIIDRSDMTVTGQVTDLSNRSPSWDVVGSLTGISEPVDLDALAQALRCDAGEVRSVLSTRGDDDVLAFLPKPEASAGLDDALAALEDHVEQVRGSDR